jgi:predicted nucleic acid-binding protein
MTIVIIDANVLVALVDARDKWHGKALALRDALLAEGAQLVYFDCVINESIGVIGRRAEEQQRSHEFAHLLDELIALTPEERITWLSPSAQRLYGEIVRLCRAHHGKLNFNDALMALAAQELGIAAFASYDGDFDEVVWLTRIATPNQLSS